MHNAKYLYHLFNKVENLESGALKTISLTNSRKPPVNTASRGGA